MGMSEYPVADGMISPTDAISSFGRLFQVILGTDFGAATCPLVRASLFDSITRTFIAGVFPAVLKCNANIERLIDLQFLSWSVGKNIINKQPGSLVDDHSFLSNISSLLSRIGSSLARPPQPESKQSINEDQPSGDFRPSKLFLIVGCVFSTLGLSLLSKIMTKIDGDATANDWLFVGGFFLALGMFVIGGMMIFHWLGLAPFEFLGHKL